jgi:2-polyprenyl-3-methyl-5-hydroxy-6-metoxy-1,4-benzoquinol methylase
VRARTSLAPAEISLRRDGAPGPRTEDCCPRTASTASQADADHALKAKHRSMWASGDYPRLAADLLPELGEVLVQPCGVTDGDRVLDIAAGSGNAAIPAARTGASVVAGDLTPELFEAGRARAAAEGVELEWREADAEALPFADGEFDVVLSAIGVMFAPHHQAAADELVRCASRVAASGSSAGRRMGSSASSSPP